LEKLQEYKIEDEDNIVEVQWNLGHCGGNNVILRSHSGLVITFCGFKKNQNERLGNLLGSGMDFIIYNMHS
jgi:hypothetical protein